MPRIDRYTCQETFARLDDYLDRELTPEEMRLVLEHLEVCAYCVLEFQFEARILAELRAKLRTITAPPDLMGKIRRAIVHPPPDTESEPER